MKRTMLFTPANNAGNVMNADALEADRIVLDLEDAVSPMEKDAARILARYALMNMHYKKETIVRINSTGTPFWKDDIQEIVPAHPDFLMLPKINSAKDIRQLDQFVGEVEESCSMRVGTVKFIALIETALGIENAYEIATSSDRMAALFLGAGDLAADLQLIRTAASDEINYHRNRVVVAARAAGVDAYDTPYMQVYDFEGAARDASFARKLGFTGKAAIYPEHAELFNQIFSPSEAEIEYASGVIEALREGEKQGKGVITYNGDMIDAPMVSRARQIMDMVNEMRGGRRDE